MNIVCPNLKAVVAGVSRVGGHAIDISSVCELNNAPCTQRLCKSWHNQDALDEIENMQAEIKYSLKKLNRDAQAGLIGSVKQGMLLDEHRRRQKEGKPSIVQQIKSIFGGKE